MAGIQPYRYPESTPAANNMTTNLGMTYRYPESTPPCTSPTSNMAANVGMSYRYPESTSAATNMATNPGLTYRYSGSTTPSPPTTSNMAAIPGLAYRYADNTPSSSPATTNMAAIPGMTYRYSGSSPNMATGMRQQFQHPESSPACPPGTNTMTNPCQPYSTVEMDYYYLQLEVGVVEPVLVTQVLGPHRFVCQLRSLSHDVQSLSESMHHYYQAHKGCGDQGLQPPLALGQPYACCAGDGRWYRSLLQELFLDKQLAMVIYVDWARKDIVPLSGLRKLAPEFLRMPVVTFPCALYGVNNGELGWDPTLLAELRTVLLGRPISAKIEWYNSYEHLYVVTLFAEDGMNLNCFFRMRSQSPQVCQIKMPSTTEPTEDTIPTEQTPQSSYVSKFPPVELKTSKFYDAVVLFVIDPFNFWVRLKLYTAEHKEMVEGMTMLYSPASKLEGIITKPKPGQLCCARYQDLYYRAEVISVDKKQVKVYFLDNGITETVDWYNIKELPGKFTKLQGLANKCSIADTFPLKDSWSQEAIRAFKVAVTDRNLVIHVVSKDADEYTIEVQDQSRIEERCVGKLLANAGLARFEELDSSEVTVRAKSAKILLTPPSADSVPEVQEIADSDLHEDNTETLQFSPFEDQLFEPGAKIEVVVSHIENPGVFWCQYARSKADLCSLMDAIQNHCMSTNCPYSSKTLACLAKSPGSEIWYRAFINEIPVNLSKTSTVQVLCVDYGMRETVPVANLRALNSEFFHLKAQAFKCSLYNIIHPKGDNPFLWDSEATEVLREFVQKSAMWTEFHCVFYASASLDNEIFNIVNLFTPFANVCDKLVEKGYATHLHHKTLAPSVQLLSYYYSMHDIKLGSDEEIYITHVDSTSSFYGQLARSTNTLEKISLIITKFIEKTQKMKSPPKGGALCLAKYSDQLWYRGIRYDSGSYEAFFVDFGNTEKLTKEDLLPIRSREHDLLLLPMQAVKFSLADIPSNVPGEMLSWFEEAVLGKALKARIVARDADGKLSVELFEGKQQINAALKNKLGVKVSKDKSDHPPAYQPKIFKQEDSRKLADDASNLEKKPPFSIGKNFKSGEPDIRSQEPEPRHKKNLTFQRKAEDKDFNSQFSSQRRTETAQRVSSIGSYQGQDGKPPSGSYQGQERKPPSGSYQGQDGKPPSGSYQGQERKPPSGSYQGQERKPPSGSYQGQESKPLSGSYPGQERKPPSGSYPRQESKPPSGSYPGQERKAPSGSYQGRDGKLPSGSYQGRDGKLPSGSYQGRDGKLPSGSYQGQENKPPSDQGSFGGRDTKQDQSKTLPQSQSSTSPAKPSVVTLRDIPQRKIFPEMKETVYVSHTNSVFDFYLQVAEDSSLEEMSEILNNEKTSFEDLTDEEIHVGNVICTYFPDDGLYYRGVVKGKSKQGLCVEYIDYGNTSVISGCKNYRLPQKCRSVPAMSIRCSLDKPKNVTSAPDLQEILAEFSKRTSDVQLDCEFRKHDGQKWHVILKDELGCINDLLTASEEVDKECEIVMKMAKEEESPSVSTFTWTLPQPGATVKVYASAADGPECFWCQLSAADIDSLTSQVQEAGEQSVKNEDFISALDIGSPCNVIFSEDNNWYRALVTKMEADLVTVRFIDYGNEDSVGREQIRQLPEHLVKSPPQAFSCCLADFDMNTESWTPEARNYFYEKVTEDALELMVCEIRESVSCPIPVACVTIKYNELNINEDMRKFWQGVQITDLKLPDKSMDSSPRDENKTEEADQPYSYRESMTTDSGANEPGENAPEGQCEEDCPIQMNVIEDICPHHAKKQESDKETVHSHLKVHVDLAAEDSDQALLRKHVPQEEFEVTAQGEIIEEITNVTGAETAKQIKDCTEELLTRDTSESLESLILHFNEKLVLLNEEAMSDDAAKEEVTAQGEIIEEITNVTGAETAKQIEDCTEDWTKQENEATEGCDEPGKDYVKSEDLLTTNNDVESKETPQSNDVMEEAACSEDLEDCGNTLGIEALDTNHLAASVDLDTAPDAATSIVTQEGETIEMIEFADVFVPPMISKHAYKIENIVTNDAEGTDAQIAIEESRKAMTNEDDTEDNTVENKVSAELLEIKPEKDVLIVQDETFKEDVQSYGGLVICEDFPKIEDPLDSEAVADGEQDSASKGDRDIEAIFSENEETDATEHVGNITSKETVQSEEDVTGCDVSECGGLTNIDFEEEDEEVVCTEGAIKLAGEDPEHKDIMNFGEAVDDDLELKDIMNGEESVDREDMDLKDSMNLEEYTMKFGEAVTDDDLKPKDTMNLEEAITYDDLELMNREESVDSEDVALKDSMKSEEAVACEDEETEVALKEAVTDDDLELKDTINCEESVDHKDVSLKDRIKLEEAVTDDDLELKESMKREESEDGEEVDFKNSMKSEEAVACEDEETEVALKEQVFYESFSTDLNDHEEPEIIQGFVESVKAKSCHHIVEVLGTETGKDSAQSEEDLTVCDISKCRGGMAVDFGEVIQEDEEVVVSTEGAIKLAGEDLKRKDSMNFGEAVTDDDLEPKGTMNLREAVTDDGLEPKDTINLGEAVTGDDLEPKDTMNLGEAVTDDDLEPKDTMNLGEAVTDDDLEPKDTMNLGEAVTDDGLEPKDTMNLGEAVTDDDLEPKDTMNLGEAVTDDDLEPKDTMNLGEAVTDDDLEPKDTMNLGEAVTDDGLEPKDTMNLGEAVTDDDLEPKDTMNLGEAVTDDDLEPKDTMNLGEALPDDVLELKDSMNREEYVDCEDVDLKDSMKSEEAVACEDDETEVAFKEVFCESLSTDFNNPEHEINQGFVESVIAKSFHHVVGVLGTETSKDCAQSEEDLTGCDVSECGDFGEVIQEDEEFVSTAGAFEEARMSFEEFEVTILKGSLTDLSQDFVAGANKVSVAGKDMERKDCINLDEAIIAKDVYLKDCMSHEEAVDVEDMALKDCMSHEEAVDVEDMALKDCMSHEEAVNNKDMELKDSMNSEEAVAEENLETKVAAFEEVACESLSTDLINDNEEPELVQELVVSGQHVVDCGGDVCGQKEDFLSADDGDMSPPDTEQGKRLDSFAVYRECPMLIASADSVYGSELYERLEKTDSDSDASTELETWDSEVSPVTAAEERGPGGKEISPDP